jgi:hypothetical protein
VLVTVDLASTVQSPGKYSLPLWILTSVGNGSGNIVKHLVIISPYEAEMLQTDVRHFKRVTLSDCRLEWKLVCELPSMGRTK